MCDSLVPYAVDGDVYLGRQSGESRQQNLGEATVLNLSKESVKLVSVSKAKY